MNYSPGFLKAACNAFNNGRQLAQWKANDDILDKLASFPLANYEEIHGKMWGESQEKAASATFAAPTFASYDEQVRQELLSMDLASFSKTASVEKQASAETVEYQGDLRAKKAYSSFEFARRELEEARREKAAADDLLNLKMHILESYFKKFAYDRLPLAQVEHGAATYFGNPGKYLMAHISERFPREKRASDHQKTWKGFTEPVNRKAEPYTLIDACIKQAAVLAAAESNLAEKKANFDFEKEAVSSFSDLRSPSRNSSQSILTPSLIEDSEKKSSLLGGATGGFTFGFGKTLADAMSEQADKRVESQIKDLDDPSHMNEMRKIRAQTVLAQLLSDPESPLSGHDPENVMKAYNELVQLTPRLADQPAALVPILNRRLVGNTEPFEVQEALKLEEGLQKTQPANITKKIENEAKILS